MTDDIRCPNERDLLRLSLGQLPPEQAQVLQAHLDRCRDCSKLMTKYRIEGTICIPPPDPPPVSHDQPTNPAPVEAADRSEEATVAAQPERAVKRRRVEALTDEQEWRKLLGPPAGPDEIGRLGNYRVLKVLGSGGMGVVFAAQDAKLRRQVALKVMKPVTGDPERARQRFLREARSAAALQHDHVVTIFQVGEENGMPFLAMQLLQGETLEERLLREPQLPIAEVLRIGREIAEGLAAAHATGVIHRDIKPSNIWLESAGGRKSRYEGRVKIVDFGLARASNEELQLTRTGTVMGTPSFMSPEQARGAKLDHRSDLFSLGGVMYRMTTGRNPFEADDPSTLLMAVAQEQPPPMSAYRPDVPNALSALVQRLMIKHPSGRVDSGAETAEILRSIEEALEAGELDPDEPQEDSSSGRHWRLIFQIVLAAGLGFAAYWFGGDLVRLVQSLMKN
jgi:serine/threonine protein kinase